MKGTQGKLPLLLGLVLVPLAVIAGGFLIASSSPDGPHLTDTHPVRIGSTTAPGSGAPIDGGPENASPPTDPADAATAQRPDTPQFQPKPPATTSGSSGSQPGSRPTTQVRPPVQTRPAPAPVPYDDDDDDGDDDDDDDD